MQNQIICCNSMKQWTIENKKKKAKNVSIIKFKIEYHIYTYANLLAFSTWKLKIQFKNIEKSIFIFSFFFFFHNFRVLFRCCFFFNLASKTKIKNENRMIFTRDCHSSIILFLFLFFRANFWMFWVSSAVKLYQFHFQFSLKI